MCFIPLFFVCGDMERTRALGQARFCANCGTKVGCGGRLGGSCGARLRPSCWSTRLQPLPAYAVCRTARSCLNRTPASTFASFRCARRDGRGRGRGAAEGGMGGREAGRSCVAQAAKLPLLRPYGALQSCCTARRPAASGATTAAQPVEPCIQRSSPRAAEASSRAMPMEPAGWQCRLPRNNPSAPINHLISLPRPCPVS